MKKDKLFSFCAAAMLLGTGAANAANVVDTWTSGSTTVVLTDDSLLTVSGTGAMANYSYGSAPWYSSRAAIKTLVINEGVRSIGSYAFFDCSRLTSATIPSSVTSIGERAFYYALKKLTIEDGTTALSMVNGYVFSDCPIDTLYLGRNITPATRFGTALKQVTIGNSVTAIGDYAFSSCAALTQVTIGNSVTAIGNYVFYDCRGLTSVTIPNSVSTIGDYAFSSCAALTQVTIGNSVTAIGNSAFSGCVALKQVTIGNSVTAIGNYVFYDCRGLTSVTIPGSVTSIDGGAFSGCTGLTAIDVDDANTMYSSVDGVVFNKNKTTLVLYPTGKQGAYTIPNSATSIGDHAFSACRGLTSVTIPNSVTSIGSYAFPAEESRLSKVIIESTTPWSISGGVFPFTTADLYVPAEAVAAYQVAATWKTFRRIFAIGTTPPPVTWECGSPNAADVTATLDTETGVITISGIGAMDNWDYGNNAPWYSYRSQITSVSISSGVTSIGDRAFYGCRGLTSVTIPGAVSTIGNSAFYDCSGLTSITIPNSVTAIGYNAFYGCSGLTSVTIPGSVTAIGNSAFYGCTGLTSVIIPNSVTAIGESAFNGCTALTKLTIEDGTTALSMVNSDYYSYTSFYNSPIDTLYLGRNITPTTSFGTALKQVTIGNFVTNIGNYAFSDCSELTEINIGSGLTNIAGLPTSNSGLTAINVDAANTAYSSENGVLFNKNKTILVRYSAGKQGAYTIPGSVTNIGESAFSGCNGLTSVTIPNSVTVINRSVFSGCSSLTSVTIPNSVTSIGESAFSGCTGIKKLTIEDGTTALSVVNSDYYSSNRYGSFYNCPIDTLYLGRNITATSGRYAMSPFGTALKQVTIGNSVTAIGGSAFSGCNGLTGALTIPGSVAAIGEYAFSGCSGLTGVLTIPNSVTSIRGYVFFGCTGLTSITIPSSVISISNYAFASCTGLTSVYNLKYVPQSINGNVFDNIAIGNVYLYVIDNDSKAVYLSANVWQDFKQVLVVASVTDLSLDKTTVSLVAGSTLQITATVSPGTATNQNLLWTSSNADVATVDNTGKVTAVAIGTTTITATTLDGSNKSATCTVTVKAAGTAIETVTGDKLQVHPNPTTGVVYVNTANGAEIKVHNLNGELLQTTRESRIDLSGEPNGVYLLRIGEQTLKVVKK
ncbi:hypothetical protein AGMMS49982_03390 [Bacteroidia bacterium]|nr:hypothetical protein AGMMS49982_03390 [Bacteroidia bacterium]